MYLSKKIIISMLLFVVLSVAVYSTQYKFDSDNYLDYFNITNVSYIDTNCLTLNGTTTCDFLQINTTGITNIANWSIDDDYLNNVSGVVTFNQTKNNATIIDVINLSTVNATNFVGYPWGSIISKPFTTVSSIWFIVSGGELQINGTYINETIQDLSTSNIANWTIDNNYLNNVSNQITFNDSKLNDTIQALSSNGTSTLNTTYTNNTYVRIVEPEGNSTINWTADGNFRITFN